MEFDEDDHAERMFLRFWDLFRRYRFRINARMTRGSGQDLPIRDNVSTVLSETSILLENSHKVDFIIEAIDGLKDGPDYIFQLEYLINRNVIEYEVWLPVGNNLFYVVNARDELIRLTRSQMLDYITRRMAATGSTNLELSADRRSSYSIDSIDYLFTRNLDDDLF